MNHNYLQLLLIENDLTEKQLLDRFVNEIQNVSLQITHYKTLKGALNKLKIVNFDLIFFALNLSDNKLLDSLQILINKFPCLPIIVLTTNNNQEFITKILDKGIEDVLLKSELNVSLFKHSIFHAIKSKKQNLALQKAYEEMEEFTYIVSHDLKQPLSTISCWTQMLYMGYFKNLDEKGQKYINSILKGTQQMDNLIQDILTYSRIVTKGKNFEPTNCEKIVNQIIINLEKIITENDAIITYDPLPTIIVDASQWEKLLQHLIENGIKYHSEEQPKIHISAHLKDKQEWVFSIQDNGIGIESEYYHKIFQIFQTLHPQSQYSGNGMGLALCDRIIKRHGGKIWVESAINQGSTFYFTIPI